MMAARSEANLSADSLHSLAEELLREVRDRDQARPEMRDGKEVLLDVELDGVQCLLLRNSPDHHPLLSPREREIARMIAEGLPNKTIASVLEISTWTVGTHLRRMFAKLGVTSRAAMVAKLAMFDR